MGLIDEYKQYIKSLYDFMVDNGYTVKPYCTIVLNNKKQEDDLLIKTGYFNPNNNEINLFINGRHKKDVLRTLAHELIHYKQEKDGIIDRSGYRGDKISDDSNLIKLEEEAYLKGNIAFRKWTEYLEKNGL